MKSNSRNQSFIRALLGEHWNVNVSASPRFQANVWARIVSLQREPATWGLWIRRYCVQVSIACVLSLACAVYGAVWLAKWQEEKTQDVLVTRYLSSIDPYAQIAASTVSRHGHSLD